MQEVNFVFAIAVLIMSIVIHEVSHGYSASLLGDQTAKYAGRLTLNPFKHLDLMGSLIVPFLLFIMNSPAIFGWAKPVPYNPYNLKNQKWGPAMVAIAGPAANFLLAIVFAVVVRVLPASNFTSMLAIIVYANIMLMVFNLVPIPPLDGSKILYALLPDSARGVKIFLDKYGFMILLFFIFFLFETIAPLINGLFNLLIGSV